MLHYRASSFYPVHIGQVFHERYQVKVKFGFGGSSTVWLCQDKNDGSHKVLKVGTYSEVENRESKVLSYLERCGFLSHNGRYNVRPSCGSSEIKVPGGAHHCLVYEPLGMSLFERLSGSLVAFVTKYLPTGLDYLHTIGVIHTDIKLDNILTVLPQNEFEILTSLINAECEDPSPRKVVDENRTIYTSRGLEYGNQLLCPVICDFGMAVFDQAEYEGLIQPIPYRVPEVILGMKWNSSVDIWNLGVSIWELIASEHLFGNATEQDCLRATIAYLGPPPREFIQRITLPSLYFDEHGEWKGKPAEQVALHERLEGAGAETFAAFLRSMLQWVPEELGNAASLLNHPFVSN